MLTEAENINRINDFFLSMYSVVQNGKVGP